MKEIILPTRELVTQVIQDAMDFQMSGSVCRTGHSGEPLHFLDITASQVPIIVKYWQMEQSNGDTINLCLAGATRTLSGTQELDILTDQAFVAIFQVCPHEISRSHSRAYPLKALIRTNEIGILDIANPTHGCLGYMILIFERDGVGVCTLLSPKLILPVEKRVILVVNPNHIEREFAIS